MRSNSWNSISGSIYIECGFFNGKLIDSHTDKELPQSLIDELMLLFNFSEEKDYFEIEIPFLSSGFSDEGRFYGPPENCYPPEFNDERILDNCCVVTLYTYIDLYDKDACGWHKTEKKLSQDVSEELFEFYHDQIYDEELDFSQYDDSDYKYERMMGDKYDQ